MIKRFIEAWKFARLQMVYSLESDTEFGWTQEDATTWKTFMLGPVGRKISQKLTNYVFRISIAATKKSADRDYHCGIARGATLTIANLQRLGEAPNVKIGPEDAD